MGDEICYDPRNTLVTILVANLTLRPVTKLRQTKIVVAIGRTTTTSPMISTLKTRVATTMTKVIILETSTMTLRLDNISLKLIRKPLEAKLKLMTPFNSCLNYKEQSLHFFNGVWIQM